MIVHMVRTRKIPFIQSRASWPFMMATLRGYLLAHGAFGCFLEITGFAIKLLPLVGSDFTWLYSAGSNHEKFLYP